MCCTFEINCLCEIEKGKKHLNRFFLTLPHCIASSLVHDGPMKTLELVFFVQRSDQAGGLWLGSALQFRGKVRAFTVTYIWLNHHFTS